METQSLLNRLQKLQIQVQDLIKENNSLKEALEQEYKKSNTFSQQLKSLEQNLEKNLGKDSYDEETKSEETNVVSGILNQTNEKEKTNLKSVFNQHIKNIDFCISFLEKNNINL